MAPNVPHTEHAPLGSDSVTDTPFVIVADGLHSKVRKRLLGDEHESSPMRRYGVRRHFACAPWSSDVEVHFAKGYEAYVTPVGSHEVGVAFLWDGARYPGGHAEELLKNFPTLQNRLSNVPFGSESRGAGPLWRSVPTVVGQDFALLGDAAGYVDAITGEGMTLAFLTAQALAAELSEKGQGVMVKYARAHHRAFARYSTLAIALLRLAEHPNVRRRVVSLLSRSPKLFSEILARAIV